MKRLAFDYIDPQNLSLDGQGIHRKDSRKLAQLAALMDVYGFCVPVVVDPADMKLIDGRCRIFANQMRKKPQKLIPAIFIASEPDGEILSAALNNPSLYGSLDIDKLGYIASQYSPCDFSAKTGFEENSIGQLISRSDENIPAPRKKVSTETPCPQTVKNKVTIIFEMPHDLFIRFKKKFNSLIKISGIDSFVRIDGD